MKMNCFEKEIRSYGYKGEFYNLSDPDVKYPVAISKIIPLTDDGCVFVQKNKDIKYCSPLEVVCMAYIGEYELLAFRMYSTIEMMEKVANIQFVPWGSPLTKEYLILLENDISKQKKEIEKENKCMYLKKPYNIKELVNFFKAYYVMVDLSD